MHDQTFDSLIQTLRQEATRRTVFGILGGIVASGVEEAAARQRHHRKRHDRNQNRRSDRHQQRPRPKRNLSDVDMVSGQCEKPVCFLGQWGSLDGTPGSGDGQFRTPRGGGVSPGGTVYIADLLNHRIQYFTATGEYVGQWGSTDGTPGSDDGQFNNPNDVAVTADGTVYVADYLNHRIQYFTAQGSFLGKWGTPDGTPSSLPGEFNEPRFVAVGPDDTVFVSDNLNHRVQYFTPTGQYLGQWGSLGSGDGQFNLPRGITVARDGNVYVVDLNNFRIQRFNAAGKFLSKWGSLGSGDGQFLSPHGVEVSAAGIIYVVDSNNNRVQYFRLA